MNKDKKTPEQTELHRLLYFFFQKTYPKLFIDTAHLYDWVTEIYDHIQEELKKLKQARKDGFKQ